MTTSTIDSELLTIAQVCRTIPGSRGNTGVSPSTITRWILNGCPGRSGTRIKLVATRAGSRWLIARRDLDAFFVTLGDPTPSSPELAIQPTRSATQRRTASERATQELLRRGA